MVVVVVHRHATMIELATLGVLVLRLLLAKDLRKHSFIFSPLLYLFFFLFVFLHYYYYYYYYYY